ncbi:MAG: hypothetical protein IJ079_01730 [Lachnospiraceae bacterium]|nr:hypothetical protein [Lachnospiraceae bacterium]MBQ8982280.1 hypothetical protein [Lachnospiraceae bacterium]
MPFVISRVNVPISDAQEKELKQRLGKAIELVPGKSEEYLLLDFEDNCRLYVRGDSSKPVAYITASIFGNEDHCGFSAFAAEVTDIFRDILGISPESCYIKFDDIISWAVNGQLIDRRNYW